MTVEGGMNVYVVEAVNLLSVLDNAGMERSLFLACHDLLAMLILFACNISRSRQFDVGEDRPCCSNISEPQPHFGT